MAKSLSKVWLVSLVRPRRYMYMFGYWYRLGSPMPSNSKTNFSEVREKKGLLKSKLRGEKVAKTGGNQRLRSTRNLRFFTRLKNLLVGPDSDPYGVITEPFHTEVFKQHDDDPCKDFVQKGLQIMFLTITNVTPLA